jgi:hypothetical protein
VTPTPEVPAGAVVGASDLSVEIPADVQAELRAEGLRAIAPPSHHTDLEIPADVLADRDAEQRRDADVHGIDDQHLASAEADEAT